MARSRAGIINVTGYAGSELARLLLGHPEVEVVGVTGRSQAGRARGSPSSAPAQQEDWPVAPGVTGRDPAEQGVDGGVSHGTRGAAPPRPRT